MSRSPKSSVQLSEPKTKANEILERMVKATFDAIHCGIDVDKLEVPTIIKEYVRLKMENEKLKHQISGIAPA